MSEVLNVSARESLGKLNNRRLRDAGQLPAVLYGHGEGAVNLTLRGDQLMASLRHGAHLVELKGAASGQALLQDVQWDTFQQHVLHVDLLRVDAKDRVKVEVPVHLKGEAPGTNEGGVIEHLRHSIEIETSAANIPEALHLSINHLNLGDTLRAGDIEDLPAGAEYVGGPDLVIVNCVEPTVAPEPEEAAAVAGAVEPEVIGEKKDEEEGSE